MGNVQWQIPVVYRQNESREYVNAIKELSPLFTKVILDQIDVLTTRKLGELLEIENIMDVKNVKDELIWLKVFQNEILYS